ncbi:Tetratricopeptide repeat protein [Maioricimonas rarisocia]|uniref:Tetratricopeptide repeat protein n=1 Tax=Maioricimonas rarisocia TaxID=2528026 RepID=A0A517ZAT4_9PLAN|nr:tetratricopeptide repeat protein [Maioricimonas rarisocia]QDU39615.1 Tetratricopeptide repeat protein [Maioricimonas rarisocia]
MSGHHFLSYSRADAGDFADKLFDGLQNGIPPVEVWMDRRCLHPGPSFDSQLAEAIRRCKTLLFVMSYDSVEETSVCKSEWLWALKYKKPVVPLLLHSGLEPPFLLGARQMLDCTRGAVEAVPRLRDHLLWLDTDEGRLEEVRLLLSAAQRDLRRAATDDQMARIQRDIERFQHEEDELSRTLENPAAARTRVRQSISRGLERERSAPERHVIRDTRVVHAPPAVAPDHFQDRVVETELLTTLLKSDAIRLVTVVGRAGIGKTALVCRLLKSLEDGRLPDSKELLSPHRMVYLSAVGSRPVSSATIQEGLSRLLPEADSREMRELFKQAQVSIATKMQRLLAALPQEPIVLLLDNFEDLVDRETGKVVDRDLLEVLRTLLSAPHHCVTTLITTRAVPGDLALVRPGAQARVDLDEGLPEPHAGNILRAMDRDGSLGLKNAEPRLLALAQERTRGYPRALEALFAILSVDRSTSLQELLEESQHVLPENVVEALVGEAFSRLLGRDQRIVQALAIYGHPVTSAAIDYLLEPHVAGIDSANEMRRLVNGRFVRKEGQQYSLHPVDREYALSCIEEGEPADCANDGVARFSRFALRHRAADYFRQARRPRHERKSLEDLAPHLAEFDLRCQNMQYDTAFDILTDIGFRYLGVWGHFRLLAEMHEKLVGRLGDQRLEQSNHGSLGNALENLGEYDRGLKHFDTALELNRHAPRLQQERHLLIGKSICHRRLGDTRRAIECNERSLEIARQLNDVAAEAAPLNNLGNRYADLGHLDQALRFYEDALDVCQKWAGPYEQAVVLESSGHALLMSGDFDAASRRFRDALAVANDKNIVQVQNYAHYGLSLVGLLTGDLESARTECEAAEQYDVQDNNHNVSVVKGIIHLLEAETASATAAFNRCLDHCGCLLSRSPSNFEARYITGVALLGLTVSTEKNRIAESHEAFRLAHEINHDRGVLSRVTRLLEVMSSVDATGRIAGIAAEIAGWGDDDVQTTEDSSPDDR